MKLIGLDNLIGEIVVRKFHLVYYHWSIALLIFTSAAVSIRVLARCKTPLTSESNKLLEVLLCIYMLLGVLVFFNAPILTHLMFDWIWADYMRSAGWSLGVAALPCVALYSILVCRRPELRMQWPIFLSLVPIVHSFMALLYIINPLVLVE